MIYILTVTIETGKAGGSDEDTVEIDIPDTATEEEKEAMFEEEAKTIFFNQCSYGYTAKPKEC